MRDSKRKTETDIDSKQSLPKEILSLINIFKLRTQL